MPRRRSIAAILKEFQQRHTACQPACIVLRCNRSTCSIGHSPTEACCLDCDKCAAFAEEAGKKPDFILLYLQADPSASFWFVVEMKGRMSHASDIVEQLQAGADAIQNDGRFTIEQKPRNLLPVVLYERRSRTAEFTRLSNKYVRFAGDTWPIKTVYCRSGIKLTDLL